MRQRAAACVVAIAIVLSGPAIVSEAQDLLVRATAELEDARRLFDALDYEGAVPALDRAIASFEALLAGEPEARSGLASGYEMRGRARFGLGDTAGAETDFRALLALDPAFAFTGQVSPRVVALLDGVRQGVVGSLVVSVEPPDAAVTLNGEPVAALETPLLLGAAEYTLAANRLGFRAVEGRVVVEPGETRHVSLLLERLAATLEVVTSPPETEVVIDGISRGRTSAWPLPPRAAAMPGELGVAPEEVSQPMLLGDIGPGAHVVQFRRDCHVTEERRLVIEDLADYEIEPIRLRPAVASLEIESLPAGAAVFIDGEPRGTAPVTLDDVCEGSRLVELRGAEGRAAQRLDVRTGEPQRVSGALKPAFAVLPAGSGVSTSGVTDVRTTVERVLAQSQQITMFVPAERQLVEAFGGQPPPEQWLAFDAGRRPIGAAGAINATARRDLSAKLGRELGVQGVAAVSQPSPTSHELVVALLAAGAGEPDVVALDPERPESVTGAVARFDYLPAMTQPSIGALVVDVLDARGPVVVLVEPGGAAAGAGVLTGETITGADGRPVTASGDLGAVLGAAMGTGAPVTLLVVGRDGLERNVQVPVAALPRLISAADQTLLFNPLAVALRARLAAAPPAEAPAVRLNLAVALLRLGDYAGAREHLDAVEVPETGAISSGTQQYLLGLALDGLGDAAGAQRAFQTAAASDASLTEDGPPVRVLAESRLRGGGPTQP